MHIPRLGNGSCGLQLLVLRRRLNVSSILSWSATAQTFSIALSMVAPILCLKLLDQCLLIRGQGVDDTLQLPVHDPCKRLHEVGELHAHIRRHLFAPPGPVGFTLVLLILNMIIKLASLGLAECGKQLEGG